LLFKLRAAGLDKITITLNTLNPVTYVKITRANPKFLELTKDAVINAAQIFGSENVQINVVLTKLNIDELPDIIAFASKLGVSVKVLELVRAFDPSDLFIPIEVARKKLGLENGRFNLKTCDYEFAKDGIKIILRRSCWYNCRGCNLKKKLDVVWI